MPAQDSCQPQVVHALQKDGWTILPEATQLRTVSKMLVYIDIEAFNANRHLFIEVKCFPRANRTQELHIAFGQYIIYREILAVLRPDAVLYLAAPHDNPDLADPVIDAVIRRNRVKMVLIALEREVITRWIK